MVGYHRLTIKYSDKPLLSPLAHRMGHMGRH